MEGASLRLDNARKCASLLENKRVIGQLSGHTPGSVFLAKANPITLAYAKIFGTVFLIREGLHFDDVIHPEAFEITWRFTNTNADWLLVQSGNEAGPVVAHGTVVLQDQGARF